VSSLRIVPNIESIILGRNMQIGQLDDPNSIKNPIFDNLSETKHKTIALNQTTFLVPDQVIITDYQTEEHTSTNEVYTSQFVLQESMSFTYSGGYNSWFSPCMFSQSYNSYTFHELYQMNAMIMASSYLRVTNYRASLDSEIKLNPFFEQQLLGLPDIYNETTCPHFKTFFNTFGTHYIYSCIFGGVVEMITSFSIQILQNTTIEQIEYDLNQQFFLMTQETLTETQEQQLTQYNTVYKSTFKLIGGDPSQYNATSWQRWANTVLSDPLVVNMEIYNFTTFLHKNYTQNKQKINALNEAIKEYFYSPYKNWQNVGTVPVSLKITEGKYSSELVYVVVGDEIYFPTSNNYNTGYYYNMKSNLWYQMTALSVFQEVVCAGVTDTIYCFGTNQQNNPYAQAYNTKTKIWTQITKPPVGYYFGGASAVNVGQYIYMMGGRDGGYTYGDWCSNWTTVQEPILKYDTILDTYLDLYYHPPGGIVNYESVVIGDTIYVIGGRKAEIYSEDCSSNSISDSDTFCCNFWFVMSNSTLAFNTTSNTWTVLAAMPQWLYKPGVAVLGNKLYVMGGSIIDEYVKFYPDSDFPPTFKPNYNVYSYDIITDIWELINDESSVTAEMGIAFESTGFLFYMSNHIDVMSPSNFC
jgi:hypothetical protein